MKPIWRSMHRKSFAVPRTSPYLCIRQKSHGRPSDPSRGNVQRSHGEKRSSGPARENWALISFGSNLGDRLGNIESALRTIRSHGMRVMSTSPLYKSQPMYDLDQEPFLNGAILVETQMRSHKLLDTLQVIELEHKRARDPAKPKGPRTLDLDILYHGKGTISDERLTVPHPGICERPFVVKPLIDMIRSPAIFEYLQTQEYPYFLKEIQAAWKKLRASSELNMPMVRPLTKELWLEKADGKPPPRPHLMAILNITPDSFSDGGELEDYRTPEGLQLIVDTARAHILAGATILDIGGQSTRPGATVHSAIEELARVKPALQAIKTIPEVQAGKVAVSLDTFESHVVQQCAQEDLFDIVNDVTAGRHDPAMFKTVADTGKSIILMHSRGTVDKMHDPSHHNYNHTVHNRVRDELVAQMDAAVAEGVPEWRIMLDPGIGFSKSQIQNLGLLDSNSLPMLSRYARTDTDLMASWVVGPSRKSCFERAIGVKPAKHRDWATAAAVTSSVIGGASILRVHNTRGMKDVIAAAHAMQLSMFKLRSQLGERH